MRSIISRATLWFGSAPLAIGAAVLKIYIERRLRRARSPLDPMLLYQFESRWEALAIHLWKRKRLTMAWYYFQLTKGRAFTEAPLWIAWARRIYSEDPSALMLEREAALGRLRQQELWGNYYNLKRGHGTEARISSVSDERDRLWARESEIDATLRGQYAAVTASARRGSFRRPPTPTVKHLQSVLHEREVFADFFWIGDELLRILVTRSRSTWSVVDRDETARLERLILYAAERQRATGSWDVDDDWAPSLAHGLLDKFDSIILSPHDRRLGATPIPFHALLPNVSLGIVPGAGFLIRTRAEMPNWFRQTPYLGVAFDRQSEAPWHVFEIESVAGRYFNDPIVEHQFVGERATELLTSNVTVELIHIACHGTPFGLELGTDYTLPPDLELLGVSAEIVLLTSCQSAAGPNGASSSDFSDVVRSLLGATGAKAAIVSADRVSEVAGFFFADLVVAALTGKEPSLGWNDGVAPAGPQCVGDAVMLARGRLATLADERRDLTSMAPSWARHEDLQVTRDWFRGWFVLGDPAVVLPLGDWSRSPAAEVRRVHPRPVPSTEPRPWDAARLRQQVPGLVTISLLGVSVDVVRSNDVPGGEMSAMDLGELGRPTIMATSEERWRCWFHGKIDAFEMVTFEDAKARMAHLLENDIMH